MIRGAVGVIPARAIEPGRFYLCYNYAGPPHLFLCVQTDERLDDRFRRVALYFNREGMSPVELGHLPSDAPVCVLDEVHIRFDPMSMDGHSRSKHAGPGTFLVDGERPVVVASLGYQGYVGVYLDKGQTVSELGTDWASFSAWSLVLDDESGQEWTIASFGAEGATGRAAGG